MLGFQYFQADCRLWSSFPICKCLRHLLKECGFDTKQSAELITENHLNECESYINLSRESILGGLNCMHENIYKSQASFKFLPGHRVTILKWSSQNTDLSLGSSASNEFTIDNPAFSPILRELISSALSNSNRDPKHRIFPKTLFDFAIYIYTLAGKASYEVICSNLPLPQVSTICK